MTRPRSTAKRFAAAATLVVLALALAACLLTPGKFTSSLDLRRDGRFSFSYTGEIHMLALGKLAAMERDKRATFLVTPCFGEAGKVRPCSAEELTDQRKAWDEDRKSRAERNARELEQMKTLLGGIDPSSPQAAEELAARLRRQAGWRSVVYKGDGLFMVDFHIEGRLDHDFAFPTVERLPYVQPFVLVTRRADGTVRVDAPGYAASGGTNPFLAMLGSDFAGSGSSDKQHDIPSLFPIDGQFTVTTDAAILANNTDEGPRAEPAGQHLSWLINPRSLAAPTALVRLDP